MAGIADAGISLPLLLPVVPADPAVWVVRVASAAVPVPPPVRADSAAITAAVVLADPPVAVALAAVGAAALADPPAVVASAAAGAAGSAAVSPEAASLVVAAAVDSADGADWKKKEHFLNGRGL